jgi:O-6-methylguanine DNA methyltransferase
LTNAGRVWMPVVYSSVGTPWGEIWLAAGERGLVRTESGTSAGAFARALLMEGYEPVHAPEELTEIVRQIEEYGEGTRRTFDAEVDLEGLTPFQERVLRAVVEVPYGEVRSYADIAEAIAKPMAARAVAGALASSPISIVVPCHRIVRSDGIRGDGPLVTGPGAEERLKLIRHERRVMRFSSPR